MVRGSWRGPKIRWLPQYALRKDAGGDSQVAFELIPSDPANPAFRQGGTLGEDRKDWLRAKFLQQFRLFFRYDSRSRVIVLVWVNDEKTRRAYGSRTDVYLVFRKCLRRAIRRRIGKRLPRKPSVKSAEPAA